MSEPIKHYISAYGIAVKHGFKGKEAEWLETLVGGNAELRYNAGNDCIEYKHTRSDEWVVLMTLAEFRGAIAEEIISSVNGAVEEANKAREDSSAAASNLQAAVSEAKSAKNDAEKAEDSARTYANSAASLARAAALAACDEKLGAILTKLKGIESGANKTVIDKEFSENSSNPVANYILLEALRTKLNSVTFNAHKVDKNNPHGVTAHLVGAYTVDETDKAIKEALEGLGSIDSEALNAKVDKAEVFADTSFGWTEFETSGAENCYTVSDEEIVIGGTGDEVIIHCAGQTLGFTYSVKGWSDAIITINGVTTTHICDMSGEPVDEVGRYEVVTNIVVPLTYMESDIIIQGGMNTWIFTGMKKHVIKGMGDIEADIANLETQVGDIASALSEIKTLQQSYIDGGAE